MPKTISKALEQRLERSGVLQSHLADLHRLAGVEAVFLNDLGREVVRFPREGQGPLHLLDQRIPGLASLRRESRQRQLAKEEAHAALPWTECIHRIQVEGEPVGYLVLSAWRTPEQNFAKARAFWSGFAREGSDLRWTDFHRLWTRLPEGSLARLDAWDRQLSLIAGEAIRRSETPTTPFGSFGPMPPLVRMACDIVQKDFRTPLTLKTVAGGCGVSAEHLSRQFHRATGLRFRDYLAETRIEAVCRELRDTPDTIAEIAQRNGFATLSRFNRGFRAIMGATPSEWRKRQFRCPDGPR